MVNPDLDRVHARLKFLLDMQALDRPLEEAEAAQKRDVLQYSLWLVGVSTAGILTLNGLKDAVSASDTLWVKTPFMATAVLFVASILEATLVYRAYLLTGESRLIKRLNLQLKTKAALLPSGLDGSLSTDQRTALEGLAAVEADIRETSDRAKKIFEKQTGRQAFVLNLALFLLLTTVLALGIENLTKAFPPTSPSAPTTSIPTSRCSGEHAVAGADSASNEERLLWEAESEFKRMAPARDVPLFAGARGPL